MAEEKDELSDLAFHNIENGIGQQYPSDGNHAHSLHGQSAAFRRAVTELLFFASIGGTIRLRCFVPVSSC